MAGQEGHEPHPWPKQRVLEWSWGEPHLPISCLSLPPVPSAFPAVALTAWRLLGESPPLLLPLKTSWCFGCCIHICGQQPKKEKEKGDDLSSSSNKSWVTAACACTAPGTVQASYTSAHYSLSIVETVCCVVDSLFLSRSCEVCRWV